jgi:hypothetical protein
MNGVEVIRCSKCGEIITGPCEVTCIMMQFEFHHLKCPKVKK